MNLFVGIFFVLASITYVIYLIIGKHKFSEYKKIKDFSKEKAIEIEFFRSFGMLVLGLFLLFLEFVCKQ